MKISLTAFALAALAFAQAATIKGTVREIPGNTPIAGVQVTLVEEGATRATAFTGNDGRYEFGNLKPGNYTVEVAKTGYWWSDGGAYMLETGGLNVTVSDNNAAVTRDLSMARPGTLRGRVVDEDGNPVAGLTLGLAVAGAADYSSTSETTDAEGRFVFGKLIANRYVVRAGPRSDTTVPLHEFNAADVSQIDEDYPVTYWPGGSDPAALLPAIVPPGGDIDIGDLRPRKVPLYRALVRLLDEACEGNLSLSLAQPGLASSNPITPSYSVPCAPEYLFTGLAAGRWRLRVTKQPRWGIVEFNTGPDSRPVEMRLQDSVTLTGRLVPGEGVAPLPPLRGAVSVTPESPGLPGTSASIETEGRMVIENAFGVPSFVRASLSTAPYYAAEVRYGGRPAPNGVITPTAGGEIEIVVDDKPGTITGRYSGGDGTPVTVRIFQMRNGRVLESVPLAGARNGTFTAGNIAPGTYRILAVRQSVAARGNGPNLAEGQSIVVRRGETTNVELRVQ